MIGLDTNILARFLLQDDRLQSSKADAIMGSLTAEEPGWIGVATLLELVWVLGSRNRFNRMAIASVLDQILSREEIAIEQPDCVQNAMLLFRKGRADFADCLIAASTKAAGCSRTVTFDRVAARDASMHLLE